MKSALTPADEPERIQELYRYDVLHTQSEEDFDEIVKLACSICNAPISRITLIDSYKQWHKAKVGLSSSEDDRNISFCAHAILENGLMLVPDARADIRFHDNPLVTTNPNIRFYAGMPLVSANGFKIGTLCVIDRVPRNLTEDQAFALKVLAKQVIKLFELRLRNREIDSTNTLLERQKKQLGELSAIQNKIISIVAHDVRGPVSSLKNIIELRRENTITTEEVMEFMGSVDRQLDSTLYMLTNLVEWGAILLRGSSQEMKAVNLYELLAGEMKIFEIPTSVKNNILHNQVQKDCLVYSDENILRFILRNLIGNANKFTENGRITVTAEREPEQYKISVADTGVGMTEEIRTNLFDPTKRNSRKGTHQENGSGLGLILSQEFAQTLATTLTVNSEEDTGTSVHFFIPANN